MADFKVATLGALVVTFLIVVPVLLGIGNVMRAYQAVAADEARQRRIGECVRFLVNCVDFGFPVISQ